MSSLRRRTVSAPHQTHWDHIFSLTVVTAGAWGWVSSFQEGDAGPPCAQLQPVSPTVQLSNYVCVCAPLISLGAVPHHHLALSVKVLTYRSNS